MNQQELWDKIAPEWENYRSNLPAKHVIEFLNKKSGNIADFGSGSGRHLIKIKDGKMFLIDFSQEMINIAKQKAKNKKINAECEVSSLIKMPYKNDFFDAGISISSIHCIEGEENRKKSIKEMYRVLKPNAEILVGVWNKNSRRFKKAEKEKFVGWTNKGKRYYYLYDEEEIHKQFKGAGFKIKENLSSEVMINFIAEKI